MPRSALRRRAAPGQGALRDAEALSGRRRGVFVDGVAAIAEGESSGALLGRVLRGPDYLKRELSPLLRRGGSGAVRCGSRAPGCAATPQGTPLPPHLPGRTLNPRRPRGRPAKPVASLPGVTVETRMPESRQPPGGRGLRRFRRARRALGGGAHRPCGGRRSGLAGGAHAPLRRPARPFQAPPRDRVRGAHPEDALGQGPETASAGRLPGGARGQNGTPTACDRNSTNGPPRRAIATNRSRKSGCTASASEKPATAMKSLRFRSVVSGCSGS